MFYGSQLRVHEPNDDRLFRGRLDSQVLELDDKENEWAIDIFVSHRGSGTTALFEAVWKSGDRTWVPYTSVAHLEAVKSPRRTWRLKVSRIYRTVPVCRLTTLRYSSELWTSE